MANRKTIYVSLLLVCCAIRGQPLPEAGSETHKPLSVLLLNGFFTGHLFPVVSLGEELVSRGHNVTLCTTVMEGAKIHPGEVAQAVGISFIDAGPDNITQEQFDSFLVEVGVADALTLLRTTHWNNVKLLNALENEIDWFDIIVCDYSVISTCVYHSLLGKRVIILASFLPPFLTIEPPWPQLPAAGLTDQSFFDRLMMALLYPLSGIAKWLFFERILLGIDDRLNKVLGSVDFMQYPGVEVPLISTTVPGVDVPNLLTPMKHYVGPVLKHSLPPLDRELQTWLDSKPVKSVIYISMGSTGLLADDAVRVLVEGILQTEYSVVWAMRSKNELVEELIAGTKDRFLIQGWVPQQTLLRHSSLVVTIHHCGFNTVQESLYNQLPVICLPHAFDHFQIGTIVEELKVGKTLYTMLDAIFSSKNFTVKAVTNAIEIATSVECVSNAERLSKIYKFAGGAVAAADLVEYYEDVGYDHLIPAFAKYNWTWVQYRNIDVNALLLIVLGIFLYLTVKVCVCIKSCLCRSS